MAKNDKVSYAAGTESVAPIANDNGGEVSEVRQKEINAFLDEFANSDSNRRKLLKAIEEKTEVEGGKYFQARLKKVQGA